MIIVTLAIMDSMLYGTNPETKLFNKREHPISASGIPQPNLIKDDCYGGAWYKSMFGAGGDSGLMLGATPPVCILHKYTKEGVQWIGTPIPGFLWFFKIPFNYRMDYMLAFIIPAIVTLISLFIIGQLISPLQSLIDQISGQQSFDAFGAKGYNVGKDIADKGQKAMAAAKASQGDAMAAAKASQGDASAAKQMAEKKGGKDGDKGGEGGGETPDVDPTGGGGGGGADVSDAASDAV